MDISIDSIHTMELEFNRFRDAYIMYERATREQRITVRSKGGIHCKKKHQDRFRRVCVSATQVI